MPWPPFLWALWTAALGRPPRGDGEDVPHELRLAPWWLWQFHLASRFGVPLEAVERRPLRRGVTGVEHLLLSQHLRPVPTDACLSHGACRCPR